MNNVFLVAALAAGANALVARQSTCCFDLTVAGQVSGTLGQLSDGQVRIGGGLSPSTFCISSNGTISDSNGRGCILTYPTNQFQCDTDAVAQSGFSINSSGDLEYNGNSWFTACQTGDNGEYNVYYQPPPSDVSGCVKVQLVADKCKPPVTSTVSTTPVTSIPVTTPVSVPVTIVRITSTVAVCPAPTTSSVVSVPTTTVVPTTSVPVVSTTSVVPTTSVAPSCTTGLASNYQFPHLIIPIDSASPNQAMGDSYFGEVSSDISTIFDFDIPYSYSGMTCSLVFLFPNQSQLQTSSYTFSGDGDVMVSELSSPASGSTTYNNAPSVKHDLGRFTFTPGNSYHIASFACPAGQRVAFEIKNVGNTNFKYFQDYNPSPIGLYINSC